MKPCKHQFGLDFACKKCDVKMTDIAIKPKLQNFRKIELGFNIEPKHLLRQLEDHPELWNLYNLRTTHPGTVHGQASDIWLRFNDINKYRPHELPQIMDDIECIDYPAFATLVECHLMLWELFNVLQPEKIGRIIITKLPPLGRILPHIDQGKYAEYYDRYHIALQSNLGTTFRCGDELVDMRPGEIWWFDTSKEHEVINASNQDRITLIVDLK